MTENEERGSAALAKLKIVSSFPKGHCLSIVNEFKTFILRGNVVDLAVGVVKRQASPVNFQDLFFSIGGS